MSFQIYKKGAGMDSKTGESWKFYVSSHEMVDQVFLVKETADGVTSWVPMNKDEDGRWSVVVHLKNGWYRFKHYTATGSTYINGGTHGMSRAKIAGNDTGVMVEPFEEAASA